MSVSYAPAKLKVPPGFEHLLEGLTREILRVQPKDIIAFSAEYFKKKVVLRDGECEWVALAETFTLSPTSMTLARQLK